MSVLPTAKEIMRAATKTRGMDSLALMPIKGGLDFAGKVLERFGLRAKDAGKMGDNIVSRFVAGPSEALTSGVGSALGEIPVFGRLFKYKLRPDDILDATKSGVKLTDDQFRMLSQKAHSGNLYTHRLTAPFESRGMYTLVLPMLAGLYVQDKWNKPKSPEQLALEQRNASNMGIYNSLLGNRGTGQTKTGGSQMNSQNNGNSASNDLLLQAADYIELLTAETKQANMEKSAALIENQLLRQALTLVANNSMDVSFVDDFVKEGMSKQGMVMAPQAPQLPSVPQVDADRITGGSSSLSSLYSDSESYIPKHAQGMLTLHEPHASSGGSGSGGSGVRSREGSARQHMDDFVLS